MAVYNSQKPIRSDTGIDNLGQCFSSPSSTSAKILRSHFTPELVSFEVFFVNFNISALAGILL